MVNATPQPLHLPIIQESGWAPWPVWADAESPAPPSGLDPPPVQPVVSHYTDCAIPDHNHELYKKLKFKFDQFLIFNLKNNNRHTVIRSGWRVALSCLRVLMSAEEAVPRELKASAINCGCVHQHCCHTSESVCTSAPPPQIFIHHVVLPFMLTE